MRLAVTGLLLTLLGCAPRVSLQVLGGKVTPGQLARVEYRNESLCTFSYESDVCHGDLERRAIDGTWERWQRPPPPRGEGTIWVCSAQARTLGPLGTAEVDWAVAEELPPATYRYVVKVQSGGALNCPRALPLTSAPFFAEVVPPRGSDDDIQQLCDSGRAGTACLELPEYAGLIFEEGKRPLALVTDLAVKDRARRALRLTLKLHNLQYGADAPERLRFKQVKYSYRDLLRFQRTFFRGVRYPGLRSAQVDVAGNRILLGVADAEAAANFERALEQLRLPADAFSVQLQR